MGVPQDTDTNWPGAGSGVDTYPDSPGQAVQEWPSNHSQNGDGSYPDANRPGFGTDTYPDGNRTPSDMWPGR